ncbi:MAG TPA: UDP-N-acetylmuramate dehydrogenase [Geobacteraceae bacterium]|nr:UDP-N-acetylmuramate dehydrogenase [Geobacteraceae bacterium]
MSERIAIRENVPLAGFTSFGVGGAARRFAEVSTHDEAACALVFAREQGLPLFVLGGGSNVLINDGGFPGLVILNRIKGFSVAHDNGSVLVSAGGGEDWQEFTDKCVAEGWQGNECLAGIPGTVGAAPVQNIGAYGQDVGQTITRVEALETATGAKVGFANGQCGFGYRASIFNSSAAGRYMITGVTFRLVPGGAPLIAYRDLAEQLAAIAAPTLEDVRATVLSVREGKGLLIREGFEQFKSAGSFFRNPVVGAGEYEGIARVIERAGGFANWAWPMESGMVKLSAACLIQCAGFNRGHRKGAVGISPRHTLIMVNYGGASAGEIIDFAGEVRQRVFERFGVTLLPEVRLVGFDGAPLG